MPLVLIVPTVVFPPGIPFTLQATAVLDVLLTVAVKACGSPSNTEAETGEMVTVTLGGGGCDELELTSPPQPRNKETRSSAGLQ